MRKLLSPALFLLIAATAQAQGDPLELARGLREIGQPDLSLEYLNYIAQGNPSEAVKVVLGLERAKTVLAVAMLETEEPIRDAGVARAKAEFEAFLEAYPKHERESEARLALAQVDSMLGARLVNQARNVRIPSPAVRGKPTDAERKIIDDATKRKNDILNKARSAFSNAAKNFESAAANLKTQQTAAKKNSPRERELRKAVHQAQLDAGTNSFRLFETYRAGVAADKAAKDAALKECRKIFSALAKSDPDGSAGWQAKAWLAMCDNEEGRYAEAEKQFKAIKTEGARTAAGQDGQRMVEFFEVLVKYDGVKSEHDKGVKPDIAAASKARVAAKTWLDKDRYKNKPTPQRLSMTYYYAFLTMVLGFNEIPAPEKLSDADIKAGKKPRQRPIGATGIGYFKEAAKYYKMLADTDNEYTARAIDARGDCVRFIVGEQPKAPKDYTDLEECQMASQIQLALAEEAREERIRAESGGEAAKMKAAKEKEKAEFDKALALADRAKELLTPQTPEREIAETRFNRANAYYTAGQYAKGAAAGEEMARSTKGVFAARGAYVAIESYLSEWDVLEKSPEPAEPAAREARQVKLKELRGKAIDLALLIDKNFEKVNETFTDVTRLKGAQMLADEERFVESFDLLGRIGASFVEVVEARYLQGRIAYLLLSNEEKPLEAKLRDRIYKKAVADLAAVVKPSSNEALKSYFGLRTLLASIHLTGDGKNAAEAEKIAIETIKAAKESSLEKAEKQAAEFAADEVRLYAIKSQAIKLFEAGKYDEMAKKMTPSLVEIKKEGSASKKADDDAKAAGSSLDIVRGDFIFYAIQGRIREGKFDVVAELFEMVESLGGDDQMMAQQLQRIVSQARPHVEKLRRDKKTGEADKVSAGIGGLLRRQADKLEKKKPESLRDKQDQMAAFASLGGALRELGQYDKAIEVLKKVSLDAADMKKIFENTADSKAAGTEQAERDQKERIRNWQYAQMELARSYRLMKKFPEADAIMKSALGDPKTKSKGWARSLEFQKEAIYLLEEKASAMPADPKDAKMKAWIEAKNAWEDLAGGYVSALSLPVRKEGEPESKKPNDKTISEDERNLLIPVYADILADYRRCMIKAYSQLLPDAAKLNAKLAEMAGSFLEIEKEYGEKIKDEPKAKFIDLLNDNPAIKAEYKKLGGKMFLDGK